MFIKRKLKTKPKTRVRRATKPVASTALKRVIHKVVKQDLKKAAETKMAVYYSSNAGFAGDGTYGNRSWSLQNQYISNTVTDLKRMLPFVVEGTADNQRIGDRIAPISLTLHGTVKVRLQETSSWIPQDLFAVIYVLEHVTFKSYTSLILGNDFNQLLKTGQNATLGFLGEVWHSQMPVADMYYRVMKKKIVRLRYAGAASVGTAPPAALVSIANSHDYLAKFSLGLSHKHLPKFKYPDSPTATGVNDPVNTAPFFCIGFYWADGSVYAPAQSLIEQQYVSVLRYKDV